MYKKWIFYAINEYFEIFHDNSCYTTCFELVKLIMKICLKTYAKQSGLQHVVIKLQERLPEPIHSPCELSCDFHVVGYGDYYLLTLEVAGELTVSCQRCLQAFQHEYRNKSQLAVCVNDTVAEALMEHFECIVADDDQVDLADLLADELYLFSPEVHDDFASCDTEISQLIGGQDEILLTTLGL